MCIRDRIDDVRLYARQLSDPDVEYISTSRGIEGQPSFARVNIRRTISFVTDTDLFSPCQDGGGGAAAPFTEDYNADQKFGWLGTGYSFRNRTSSLAPQLAGIGFTPTNGDQFRIDLPHGPGTYRIGCVSYDPLSSMQTQWNIHDGGTSGTLITSLDETTVVGSQYVDISNTRVTNTSFDFANEAFIEHTFTGDHITWTRDSTLNNSGDNGCLSSAWVQYIPDVDPPDPPSGFYNPFISKTFYPNYTRRVR